MIAEWFLDVIELLLDVFGRNRCNRPPIRTLDPENDDWI